MKIKLGNCCRRFRFSKSGCLKFSLIFVWSLFAFGVALAQNQASKPPADTERARELEANQPASAILSSELAYQEKPRRNEISVSGDFLYGQGHVTMPFFFSLREAPGYGNLQPFVANPPRHSDYYGATLSYSRGPSWSLEASYAHGTSSGNVDIQGNIFDLTTTAFSIDDDDYQLFIKYVPKWLLTTPYFGYLRAGASYVDATLKDSAVFPPPINSYNQTDQTTDILGNLGFGFGYYIHKGDIFRLALQVEGEGFYGHRSQDSQENVTAPPPAATAPSVSLGNDLYGGIGRGTVRFQWALAEGKYGLLKVYSDIGVEAKYTIINYSASANFAGGSYDELLWGPYVKVGLRFDF